VRWAAVLIFALAAWTNTRTALTNPLDYQAYVDLAILDLYRDFIVGWFRGHTRWLVLPIAAGQLTIALLLLINSRLSRWVAVCGALVFLLAIAPLGIGSAFPFSLTYGLALIIMARRLDDAADTPTNRIQHSRNDSAESGLTSKGHG